MSEAVSYSEIAEEEFHTEEVNHNQDVSRERYTGYNSQSEYQRDLKAYYNEKICGALTNSYKFCRSSPLPNGRCRFHGGKAAKMEKAGNFKHGGYSKYLPQALMDKYKTATEDEELLSLKDEAALVTARLYELSEKITHTAGKINYMELLRKYENYKAALRANMDSADFLLSDFEATLVSIKEDLRIWDEIALMIDTKRKIVDSEFKKMKAKDQYVEVEKVMLLVGGLMDIVSKEIEGLDGVLVDDAIIEKTTREVARKFRLITNRGAVKYKQQQSAEYG